MTEEQQPGFIQRAARGLAGGTKRKLSHHLGGAQRTRVVVLLACVLGLSAADASTVGASATELREGLHISNTDIGLLVAVTSLVAALATLPFGVLADRVRRTWVLGAVIVMWGAAMLWSASVGDFGELLLARVFLGAVTAAAGPLVASLIGDYFLPSERGRIYGFILAGELIGSGFGFAVTGDIATLSWRAAVSSSGCLSRSGVAEECCWRNPARVEQTRSRSRRRPRARPTRSVSPKSAESLPTRRSCRIPIRGG